MATRDPEATKARILAAALHEFSAKGISGARVDAIAARARVNKRMLYYYFGSKEGLFREILRRRLHERSAALRTTGVAQPERLADRHQQLVGDQEYARLLMWEALETEPDHPANAEVRRDFFRTWVATVEEEQRAGRLPSDLDAAQLVFTEISIVLGPMVLPQLAWLVTGRRVDDPEFRRARQEFLEALGRRLVGTPVDAPARRT
jgi:TetR/AcrR family transcriptional regulator